MTDAGTLAQAGERERRRRYGPTQAQILMLAPAMLVAALLLGVPLVVMLFNSVTTGEVEGSRFTLEHYVRIFSDRYYWEIMGRTLYVSTLATAAALLVGYPAALCIFFSRSKWRSVFLLIVVSPLFISVVVRTYGWIVILSPNGVINAFLPEEWRVRLLYTTTGMIMGLVHVYIPFMVLALNSAFAKIDRNVITAATTLGASHWQLFRDMILPLTRTGILAGCSIVFAISTTAFSTPLLLGGSRNRTLSYLVYQQNLLVGDWQFGSALGILLITVTLTMLALFSWLGRMSKEGRRT